MKLYRLKEEAKKFIKSYWHDKLLPFRHDDDGEDWSMNGITLEALDEVEQRVELKLIDGNFYIRKKNLCQQMTEEERLLCEQALNGELMTMDQCIALYDEWLNTTTDLLLTDWIKQRTHKNTNDYTMD